jgi:hypothetical protein
MLAFMALIVTFIELLLEHELAWGVIQQLRRPNFTHFSPPISSGQLWTFYIKPNLTHVTMYGLSTEHLPTFSCPRRF